MADAVSLIDRARDAFERREWAAAREQFHVAREEAALSAADVFALAESAWWLGMIDESLAAYEEAYRLYLYGEQPQPRQAAKLAMEISFFWFLRGESAIGSGWISRARRLLDEEPECVEHGYLLSFEIDDALAAGDFDAAVERASELRVIAERYRDPTLGSLALVGEGIALINQGRVGDGMAVLDEAMLPVLAGEVVATYAGSIYCQLMGVCHELADLRRAREWTAATERWCEQFTSAVMFVGICRVHRAQLLCVQGEWGRAEAEAARVCDELAEMNVVVVAEGHYQVGEVRRLRGDLSGAEDAYTHAHQLGRDPQPGLALLRLAEGQTAASLASIRTALAGEVRDRLVRARLCAAQVEIALSADDLEGARQASFELEDIASSFESPGLDASARQARGAVLLAEGSSEEALPVLRSALQQWQELDAPYEGARVRVSLARAYRDLSDHDAAAIELDAAAAAFDLLGASLDLHAVARLRGHSVLPGGLTEREAEVLALVAEGKTNREVAAALYLSEKTVARHLSNVFAKLAVSSRTAAAAYAFEHGLVSPASG